MSDFKLFRLSSSGVSEVPGATLLLEKSLQTLVEHNLEGLLGIRFLSSGYRTTSGRIDTLGVDENFCPVIIEYKRSSNENVINQGLFYLDWLKDHRQDFEWLMMERFGKEDAAKVEWSSPRLICIAGAFTRNDEHAVKQISRNIELIRYRRFGDELLLLDLVTTTTANGQTVVDTHPSGGNGVVAEIVERLASLTPREREVLDRVVVGQRNKTIAYDLVASPRTIEVHRARVMEKMGARSLSELVRKAIAAEGTRSPGEPLH